jgi:hypothetical protein
MTAFLQLELVLNDTAFLDDPNAKWVGRVAVSSDRDEPGETGDDEDSESGEAVGFWRRGEDGAVVSERGVGAVGGG